METFIVCRKTIRSLIYPKLICNLNITKIELSYYEQIYISNLVDHLTFLNLRVILSLSPIDKYRDLFFSPSINLGGKVQTPFL